MRRKARQMEAGWPRQPRLTSKVRLLPGLSGGVEVETPQVPGTDDQIDVEFVVEEQLGAISNIGILSRLRLVWVPTISNPICRVVATR